MAAIVAVIAVTIVTVFCKVCGRKTKHDYWVTRKKENYKCHDCNITQTY